MKVRIAYTTHVDDDYRRAIRLFYGQDGLATREEVRRFITGYGQSMDDDIMFELQQHENAPNREEQR